MPRYRHELTADIVDSTVRYVLSNQQEDTDDTVTVQGVVHGYRFDKQKLEDKRYAVWYMLMQLPHTFRKTSGGGWTFLNACRTENSEEVWGQHLHIDCLVCMGIALGYAEWCMPRDMWDKMPGGVPYFAIIDDAVKHTDDMEPISEPKLMSSGAGYYVGRMVLDKDMQLFISYDRQSEYFATKEEAQAEVDKANGKEVADV